MSSAAARPRSSSTSSRPSSRASYKAAVPKQSSNSSNGNNNSSSSARNSSSSSEKRQIVGQYMLGKTIGEGTFGKVKLAVHMPSGEKVAIKILEKSRIKEAADVRRVNREIKILKKARHGNIIQLYEVLDTQHAIYLIMECAEGGEMFDFIVAQKHVPEIQACKFFHQIVEGVDTLHKNEITHRDLKPENLLLKASPDGWIVKVVDFGLSNTHEGGRLLATACGSPCYAAPEMIAGKKYVGPMADIWSMGVILFALVCGYLPFEDANTAILYKKILSGDYKPPKWISPEVKDLIRCILEVDPKKRYTMNDVRRHPWYNLVPESAIPKEIVDEAEDEIARAETLKLLSTGGLDMQALLDGLASHACNSLTATYYLFEQKYRSTKAKNQQNQGSNNNNAGANNGTSGSAARQQPLILPSTTANAAVSGSKQPTGVIPGPMPQTKPITVGPAANNTAINSNNTNQPAGAITAYLQTPQIIQQARQQAQQGASNVIQGPNNQAQPAGMPSLDYYMKTGLTLPIGNAVASAQNATSNNTQNNANGLKVLGQNNNKAAGGDVPRLSLKVNPGAKPTIPPIIGAGQSRPVNNNGEDVLTSQTARGPGSMPISMAGIGIAAPGNNHNNSSNVPQTARAVLETAPHVHTQQPAVNGEYELNSPIGEMGVLYADIEGKGRPSTRRSRMRSRGGENVVSNAGEGELAPAQGLDSEIGGIGPIGAVVAMEAIDIPIKPANNAPSGNNSTQMTKQQILSNINKGLGLERLSINQPSQPSQPPPSSNAIRAPEGAPRSSGQAGGRRGKNIVQQSQLTQNTSNNTESEGSPTVHTTTPPNDVNVETTIQPQPPSSNPANSAPSGGATRLSGVVTAAAPSGLVPVKPGRPLPAVSGNSSPLPAGVAPDSTAHNALRQEANRNKLNAMGTFKINN